MAGGAGVVSKGIDSKPFFDALTRIMTDAYKFAKAGQSMKGKHSITALDLVEYTVTLLENDPLFNAGRGAVFTNDETHEMEASIMNGSNLQCGAVSLIKSVKNPITLARTVMEKTKHNYLVGESAEKLAIRESLELRNTTYFSTEKRREQLILAKKNNNIVNDHDLEKTENILLNTNKVPSSEKNESIDMKDASSRGNKNRQLDTEDMIDKNSRQDAVDALFPGSTGTVGCVCMFQGHVAAATSTGGLTNKMAGRIGDTPIIGAGTYANDRTCAVSATGKGEEFMRYVAAYDVSARIEIGGMSLNDAVKDTVFKKLPTGSGGIIAVNSNGDYSMEFNSKGMFRGVCDSSGNCEVGIWEDLIPFKVKVDDNEANEQQTPVQNEANKQNILIDRIKE
jgi:beta-aspartyl-peptidase (threonine type)